MANELPPDGFEDHPPDGYAKGSDGPPDGFDHNKTTLQKVIGASEVPVRGLRGLGVGAERLIAGDRPQEALEKASEATQPGYQPKSGEKIGAFSGEMMDPRFMLFGGAGEKLATTGLMKAVAGGAAALGGVKALDETEELGSPTLKGTGESAAFGAAGGAVLHGAAKLLEPALAPVIEKAGQFLKELLGKNDPISFGKVVEAGESITNKMGEGKTLQQASSEMGLDAESGRKIAEKWAKAKPHVVETELLPTIDKAIQGDAQSQVTVLQKVMNNVYTAAEKIPVVKDFVVRPTEASSSAENLFKRRYSEIALGRFEGHLFARDALKGLDDVDRQALPFILEKKVPDAEKFFHDKKEQILQTAEGYLENPDKFPHLKSAVEKIGGYYDEGHSKLKEFYDDIGFREDYINHIWEKPPELNSSGPGKGSLSQYNPFSKKRFIASYADGINQGKTPKTLDIGQLLDIYDNFKVKTIANARFVDALKEMKVEGNLPAIMDAEKAPKDWLLIDNTALNRKRLIPGENGEPPMFMTQPVRVSPEIAPAVRAIIDKPFATVNPGPHAGFMEKAFYHGTNAYEYVNAVTKKLKLSLSFFHHFALTETSMLTGDPTTSFRVMSREAKQILNDAGMNPGALYKAFAEGHPAYNNIPLAKDGLAHGLQLGPIGDVQSTKFQKVLSGVEGELNKFPGIKIGKVLQPVRKFNEIWDKALWDYYSAGMKLDLYERQVAKNIRQFGDTVPVEKIKRDTADFINKAMGGSFETLMMSPRYKQILQWGLLAPDWTIGRLQIFGSVFKDGVQGAMGRKFWLKAGLAYVTMINTWNYVNTKRDGLVGPDGKPGRMLWDNEEGKHLHLYLEKDPETGRNVYILPAKAITEPVGWYQEPFKTLGKKASPAIQMMVEAMYGKASGRNVVPKEDQTVGGFIRRYEMPIGADTKRSYMHTFPKSFGMSKSGVIEMMQRGYESKNMDMVGTALGWAAENGYDPKALQVIAYGNFKRGLKKAAMQGNLLQ
jgi:hypothetical protein